MESVSINGVVQSEFAYHALGQQVVRRLTVGGQTIHSVHDADGNRIAEYNYDPGTQISTLLREYVWMNGENVAVVEGGVVYYVRTDHIGRPVFATDNSGTKVWEASYLPFGGVHTSTGNNSELRFPGQWFQSEAGLHQNWMRDYDPTTGRYIQADPLGLVDGASVYGYVRQNPGRYSDPTGQFLLNPWTINGARVAAQYLIRKYAARRAAKAAAAAAAATVIPSNPPAPTVPLPDAEDQQCEDEDCTPANAKFWNSLQNYRGPIRSGGKGRKRRYYTWDYLHYCEVEVFDRFGNHLGAVDGHTGQPIPGKEKGDPTKSLENL